MPTRFSATPAGPDGNALDSVRAVVNWMAHSPGRAFLIIFILSFAIRLIVFLTLVPLEYVRPHTRWEMEAVSVSLAQTGRFADPYALPTGPTAHLPPILPFIYGLIYRVLGFTLTAGYVVWLLRFASYAAMYAMLPWLGGKLGAGRQAGVLGGIAGALVVQWPGHGEALTAIVLGLLLIAFLRRWTVRRGSAGGSVLLGVAAGAAFHLQPVLLPVVLGCVAFELWWSRGRRNWILSAMVALGIVFACVPWGWRNYTTFHEVFFIRSNLGLELRMAYHEGAAAAMEVMDRQQEPRHPRTHPEEAEKLRELGELEYMRRAGREAVEWIRAHPTHFLRLSVLRVIHFWFGPLHRPWTALGVTALTILAALGAWRTLPTLAIPQRAALLIPLVTYPLIYYFVTYMSRYRVPLNWILLLFAGAEVWHWIKRR